MSGRQRKGSKQLSMWLTKGEREAIESEMRRMGFKNISDLIRHKLGLKERPKGRPSKDGG